ncbi:Lsr2 family protein [Saccharopolyspora sp. K220]|nr:Lsr2 family protein [Saccharopolyspora soli]MCI2422870.1 Lsr2 family protein [Saccharopolyspora soli]
MAQEIVIELVDDVDGSPANHTITFALDGVTYEIDLSDANAHHLRAIYDRYIKAGRGQKPPARRAQQPNVHQRKQANQQTTDEIRKAAHRAQAKAKAAVMGKPADHDDAEHGTAPLDAIDLPEPDEGDIQRPEVSAPAIPAAVFSSPGV